MSRRDSRIPAYHLKMLAVRRLVFAGTWLERYFAVALRETPHL